MKYRTSFRRRRAVLLVSVLVSLALVMLLFAATLRTIGLERRQMRAIENRVQAEYLAESALRRAAVQLAADPAYAGEIWPIGPDELAGRAAGSVAIEVQAVDDRPLARKVRAVADFPAEGPARARRSKQTEINLASVGETR